MRTFEAIVVGRPEQSQVRQPQALCFKIVEVSKVHRRIAFIEIVTGLFHLVPVIDLPISHMFIPSEIIHGILPLQIHGQTLKTVGDLGTDRLQINAADLLEICKLGNFHPV